jgi:ATP-dependent Clp protease protease subunit
MNRNNVLPIALSVVLTSFVILMLGRHNEVSKVPSPSTEQAPSELPAPAISSEVSSVEDVVKLRTKTISRLTPKLDRTLRIEGPIGENVLATAEELKRLGSDSKEPITLLLNSPGGSVLDGAMVISAIEGSKAPVLTVCLQLCASMAAVIHQYGTKRLVADRSILMFHDAAGGASGYFPHITSRMNVLTKYINRMNLHIANRAKMPLADLINKMHTELWLDAEDAVANNFADGIVSVVLPKELNPQTLPQTEGDAKSKINIIWN